MTQSRIGPYDVDRVLAERGGALWMLAERRDAPGQKILLQRVLPSTELAPSRRRLFLARVREQARVKHFNVVQVQDISGVGGDPLVVYEFVPGWSLDEVVRTCAKRIQPLPLGFGCELLAGTLFGLEAAHRLRGPGPLVHGSLDLSEIRVTVEGHGKVKGFARPRLRNDGRYRSAERLRGEEPVVASDLFAVGLMLYEVVTGRPVFGAFAEAVSTEALLEEPIPDPREHNPGLPTELAELVLRATSRDAAEQPQSALAFARQLERALESVRTPEAEREAFLTFLERQAPKLPDAPALSEVAAEVLESQGPIRRGRGETRSLEVSGTGARVRAAALSLGWTVAAGVALVVVVLVWRQASPFGADPTGGMKPLPPSAVVPVHSTRPHPDSAPPAAQTPEARREPEGKVTVVTQPPGAEVRYRGQFLGVTPLFSVPLPSGERALDFTLPNGRQVRIPVTVVAAKTTLQRLDLTGP